MWSGGPAPRRWRTVRWRALTILTCLLNSLGPREGHHFYWDESLHGEIRSTWSYAAGPALTMLWFGLAVLALLVVLSFSRRTGPVRELPAAVRTTPIEFLEALGSLYRNAGAASATVAIALGAVPAACLAPVRAARQTDGRGRTGSSAAEALSGYGRGA